MPILGTCEPVTIATAIAALLTALGLSAASGLRAYLPVAAVFVGSVIPDGCSQQGDLITLSTAFQRIFGQSTPWVLVAILAVLAGGEFIIDKVPVIDHASDLIHTVIRPLAGAAVMAGVSNPLSEWNPWAAAVTGAALALAVHGAKATTRAASTATTVGTGQSGRELYRGHSGDTSGCPLAAGPVPRGALLRAARGAFYSRGRQHNRLVPRSQSTSRRRWPVRASPAIRRGVLRQPYQWARGRRRQLANLAGRLNNTHPFLHRRATARLAV